MIYDMKVKTNNATFRGIAKSYPSVTKINIKDMQTPEMLILTTNLTC